MEGFVEAIHHAEQSHALDISQYVNTFPSREGDYFLIPSGTVHCSGADNLVLEISSTPYWYTFKLYDYLRPDLTGKPRPINSKFGLEVLDTSKATSWVKQHLIPEPRVIREEEGGREEEFGTTHLAFFGTRRLTVADQLTNTPNGYFEILVLVKGEKVQVTLEKDPKFAWEMHYLESLVIPAASGTYTITNEGPELANWYGCTSNVKSQVRRCTDGRLRQPRLALGWMGQWSQGCPGGCRGRLRSPVHQFDPQAHQEKTPS